MAEARDLELKAVEEARRVQAEAEAAETRRAALAALTPTGWRRPWWWACGRLRPHRAAVAEATVSARYAAAMALAHGQVASGRAHGVKVEIEKVARRRPAEVQRRRVAEAAAVRTMEQAAIAADLLRADPSRGALAVPDLMRQAEAERRRRKVTKETAEVQEHTIGSIVRPR